MFNMGISEVVLIAIIALIFIGPKQLPEIARALGRALNELKRASEDLTSTLTDHKNYMKPDEKPSKLVAYDEPEAPQDKEPTKETKKDEGHS